MITDIHSEDRLVQQTFAEHLERALGWGRSAHRTTGRASAAVFLPNL